MEIWFAFGLLLATAIHAVVIVVNIEKGKQWALDIAKAMSTLDPNSMDRHLRFELEREVAAGEVRPKPESDRLAA